MLIAAHLLTTCTSALFLNDHSISRYPLCSVFSLLLPALDCAQFDRVTQLLPAHQYPDPHIVVHCKNPVQTIPVAIEAQKHQLFHQRQAVPYHFALQEYCIKSQHSHIVCHPHKFISCSHSNRICPNLSQHAWCLNSPTGQDSELKNSAPPPRHATESCYLLTNRLSRADWRWYSEMEMLKTLPCRVRPNEASTRELTAYKTVLIYGRRQQRRRWADYIYVRRVLQIQGKMKRLRTPVRRLNQAKVFDQVSGSQSKDQDYRVPAHLCTVQMLISQRSMNADRS